MRSALKRLTGGDSPSLETKSFGKLSDDDQEKILILSEALGKDQTVLTEQLGMINPSVQSEDGGYDSDDTIILVRVGKGEVAGYATMFIANEAGDKVGVISELFVNPDYRGKGFATLIIEEAGKYSKKNKADFLILGVMANNEPAIKLYKRHGFNTSRLQMFKKL